MIISVTGELFVFETQVLPGREELEEFFRELGEHDVLEIRLQSGDGVKVCHVTKKTLEYRMGFVNLAIPMGEDSFQRAADLCPRDFVMPVVDGHGNCVNLVRKVWSSYSHVYQYEGQVDVSFLNRYDRLALVRMNEYSVELFRRAIPLWKGREVLLVGDGWRDFARVLPGQPHVQVTILDRLEEWEAVRKEAASEGQRFLSVVEGIAENEGNGRYESGLLYYDEVMTLTFLFSHVTHPGTRNPGEKFFVIDGSFSLEGMFAIWMKTFTAARYALARGYAPIFAIVSSDRNMYSDHPGDDIWNKFFLQPGGYTMEEVEESSYVAHSPNMNLMNTVRYIMDQVSAGRDMAWPEGIWNSRVKEYIESRQKRFLPHPQETLGVLVRGTDYVHNPLPNHPTHATVDQVLEKISQVEGQWKFQWIYLATEDADICEAMKETYGDRLLCTDQERYQVKPRQLLVELHKEKQEGKGFRLGAEYLCSVSLLARCSFLIASGPCGALGEALRQNGGQYREVFVFGN